MAKKTAKKKGTTKKKAKAGKKKAPADRPMRMTDVEKKDIMERVGKGQTAPQIAKAIDRSYVTVLKYIKSQKGGGAVDGGGAARKLSQKGNPQGVEAARKKMEDAIQAYANAVAVERASSIKEKLRSIL